MKQKPVPDVFCISVIQTTLSVWRYNWHVRWHFRRHFRKLWSPQITYSVVHPH